MATSETVTGTIPQELSELAQEYIAKSVAVPIGTKTSNGHVETKVAIHPVVKTDFLDLAAYVPHSGTYIQSLRTVPVPSMRFEGDDGLQSALHSFIRIGREPAGNGVFVNVHVECGELRPEIMPWLLADNYQKNMGAPLPKPQMLSVGTPNDIVYRHVNGDFSQVADIAYKTIKEATTFVIS